MIKTAQQQQQQHADGLSLWFGGERLGRLGPVDTDQPWLFADVTYEQLELAAMLERVSHFRNVLVEQMPDFDDEIESDQHYDAVLLREGLTHQAVEAFSLGGWEICGGGQREAIQVFSLSRGTLQWRGPMGSALRQFIRAADQTR